eukprot:CAMPEP_0183308552 /NCGR_PEP_ID=MMETSP0160_2-20130417/22322_1 /TAXON_ID=2839 ORGANISM="Odontella Sinensis, Strain Grunow 1884" /NCGR_SAMPLE_ID=MMETSP0160_2 /ASSEMBLY_ACC=CAM_ASM_000250 /LENGTH=517 /DNA_ID=CAMNT_0025472411 /DNA_START=51 /DNA_END=1604 /DNA_ORIENTATION=-
MTSRWSLVWRLYGASLLETLSQAAAILVAKAFNSAYTQSVSPATACSEHPAGDWQTFGLQLAFSLVMSYMVLRSWFLYGHAVHLTSRLSNTTVWTKLWDIRKFMSGEILGWAYKELTVIGVALMAGGLGYIRVEEEGEEGGGGGDEGGDGGEKEEGEGATRFLRGAIQGEAPLSDVTQNEWKQVAAYAIYTCILAVVVLVVFGLALNPWIAKLVRSIYHLFHRRLGSPLYRPCLFQSDVSEKLDREITDDLAKELATESLKISQAYTINGAISGMFVIGGLSMKVDPGDFSWGAFGLLEVYASFILFLGGYIFSRHAMCETHEILEQLAEFYKDVWACLAGFALGSIATSPGGILSNLHLHMNETAADAVKAAIISALALLVLLSGCKIRVFGRIYGCPINQDMAHHTGLFFSRASSLAVAWAWEDYSQDFICEVLPEIGINEVGAVWLHALIMVIVMIPIAMILSLQAQKYMVQVEEDLKSTYNKDKTDKEENGETGASQSSYVERAEDVSEDVNC